MDKKSDKDDYLSLLESGVSKYADTYMQQLEQQEIFNIWNFYHLGMTQSKKVSVSSFKHSSTWQSTPI